MAIEKEWTRIPCQASIPSIKSISSGLLFVEFCQRSNIKTPSKLIGELTETIKSVLESISTLSYRRNVGTFERLHISS